VKDEPTGFSRRELRIFRVALATMVYGALTFAAESGAVPFWRGGKQTATASRRWQASWKLTRWDLMVFCA